MRVAARQVETTIVEEPHDLRDRAELQEHLKHKSKSLLNRHVGVLDHHATRITHQADRQGECKFAPLGLSEEASGQATADCVQFKLRYRPLQAEQKPAVGAPRIIDPVTISDATAAQAADIQKRVPV